MLELTTNEWVNKKYEYFIEKKRKVPKAFQPYNEKEIGAVCSTITTNTGTTTGVGTVLLIRKRKKNSE